jgi:hypothetical protein
MDLIGNKFDEYVVGELVGVDKYGLAHLVAWIMSDGEDYMEAHSGKLKRVDYVKKFLTKDVKS